MKSKIYLISSMLIFGSIGLFVRGISISSSQIALCRGIIGSVFLLSASILLKKKMSWKAIKPNFFLLLLSGTGIGFNWILLFEAYHYTSIANATVSYYFAPVFVMFLSPFLLKEKLSPVKVICILTAMIGMFFVVGAGEGGKLDNTNLIGIGYGLSAAVLYASVVIMNKYMKGLTGLETTFVQISMASLTLLPYVLATQPFDYEVFQGTNIPLLLIVGLLHTGLAYLLYFTAIHQIEGQTVAVYSYIDPISAILMSSIFFQETMGITQILGSVLILGATFWGEIYSVKLKKR
ncbi:MAG: transporter [Herbinix sp.]|jgi:drug/metabolite transporter (DMT)-like permease|nr:transporter [Herbinix sp.]